MKSIEIVLADDHKIVIDGIKAILKSENKLRIVRECGNGREVLEFLESMGTVDVVILDINMPEMDGIECATQIKRKWPQQRILILTMYNDPQLIKKMMEVGADGFVLKNTGKSELMEAIDKIMQGQTYFGRDVTESLAKSFQKQNPEGRIQLTRREKEVLRLLFEGMTSQDIANKLFISSHTVDSHRKNLLSKFNAKNTTSLLREAGKMGIV